MARTSPTPPPAAKAATPPLAKPGTDPVFRGEKRGQSLVSLAVLAVVILAGLAGVAERLWLTSLAPRWAYKWDHFDNIQMGRTASQEGLFLAYAAQTPPRMPPGQARPPGRYVPDVKGQIWEDGAGFVPITREAVRQVNYPPLGLTLYWVQSSLLEAVAPGQPVNTFTSRLVMSLVSVLAELAAAVAAFLIVRRLVGTNAGLLAAAACWLLPPMAMDSSFWGQTDAWFIAPALFTIWLMIRGGRRAWVAAGALAGVTLLLKPQGIFLGPIVLMGAILLPVEEPELALPTILKRIGVAAGAGLGAFFVLSLPWTVAGGSEWVQLAYLKNVGLYIETTMKAFNVWYLDALLHDSDATMVLYSKETILGVAKSAWGTLFVAGALIASAILYYRKFPKKGPLALVLFSGVWLWSTFVWPTGVHERYIMYAIPVMVIASFSMKRLWPAAILLALVGSFELCHNVWLPVQAGKLVDPLRLPEVQAYLAEGHRADPRRFPTPTIGNAKQALEQNAARDLEAYRRARSGTAGLEWFLTLGCLAAYGWAFAAPFLKLGAAPPTGKPQTKVGPQPTIKAPSGARRK
jgi:Gpi18-like mannosyltransferase